MAELQNFTPDRVYANTHPVTLNVAVNQVVLKTCKSIAIRTI